MRNTNNKNNGSGWALMLACALFLVQPLTHAQTSAEQGDTVEACQRLEELSARLACFDRVFPPIDESAQAQPANPAPAAPQPAPVAAAEPAPPPAPPPVPPAVPAEQAPAPQAAMLPPAAQRTEPPETAGADDEEQGSNESIAHIVAVETPSISSTYFHAADGRVFARERALVKYSWPEPPFDAEIQISRFGGMYLKLPNNLRVRVAVLD